MSKAETVKELYKQLKDMDIGETLDLELSAETTDQQEFFSLVIDFILQQKQKSVINDKRF